MSRFAPLLAVLLAGPALAQTSKPTGTEKPKQPRPRWSIPEAGISMEIPPEWEIRPGPKGRPVLKRATPGILFTENVNVALTPLLRVPGTMEEALELVAAQYKAERMAVRETKVTQVGGRRVGIISVSGQIHLVPGRTLRIHQLVAYQGKLQVVVTATTLEQFWPKAAPLLKGILRSVRFGTPKKVPLQPVPRSAFPTFGFSLVGPRGWFELSPTRDTEAVRWQRPTRFLAKEINPLELSVDVLPLTHGRTEKGVLGAMERNCKGSVKRDAVVLGGVKAHLVAGEHPTRQRIYVVKRDGNLYALSVYGVPDAAEQAVIDGVLKSWTWLPPADPSQHLQLFARAKPVFGRFLLKLPRIGRPSHPTKDTLKWWVVNYQTKNLDLMIQVHTFALPQRMTLELLRDRFSTGVARQLELDRPLKWSRAKSKAVVYRSNHVTRVMKHQPVSVGYALFFAAPRLAVSLTFTCTAKTAAARARYRQACIKVADSVLLPRR